MKFKRILLKLSGEALMGDQKYGIDPAVVEKIVEGKMNKIFEEVCLLEQPFIMSPDLTIQQYLSQKTAEIGEKLSIRRFTKYIMGEGLEKRSENFAAEVAAAK